MSAAARPSFGDALRDLADRLRGPDRPRADVDRERERLRELQACLSDPRQFPLCASWPRRCGDLPAAGGGRQAAAGELRLAPDDHGRG